MTKHLRGSRGRGQDGDPGAPVPAHSPAASREPSLGERIQALSDALALPSLSIYLLEPTEQPARRAVSRAGGAAFGVPRHRWPRIGGDPMAHLLTLDLDQLPDLRARRAGLTGVRALALFVPDWDSGIGADEGVVLKLSEADLAAGISRTHVRRDEEGDAEVAMEIQITRVTVPELVFRPSEEWGLPADAEDALLQMLVLRDLLDEPPGRALGYSLWLQDGDNDYAAGEAASRFLLQLDDRLVEFNTADEGILYVFEDSLELQSH